MEMKPGIEITPDGIRGSQKRVQIDFDDVYKAVKANPTPPKEVVQMPDFEQKERRKPCVYGPSPLRNTNIQLFQPKSKSY